MTSFTFASLTFHFKHVYKFSVEHCNAVDAFKGHFRSPALVCVSLKRKTLYNFKYTYVLLLKVSGTSLILEKRFLLMKTL